MPLVVKQINYVDGQQNGLPQIQLKRLKDMSAEYIADQ